METSAQGQSLAAISGQEVEKWRKSKEVRQGRAAEGELGCETLGLLRVQTHEAPAGDVFAAGGEGKMGISLRGRKLCGNKCKVGS